MRVAALLMLIALAGCSDDFVERSTRVNINADSDDFWALPLPSDHGVTTLICPA